MLLSSSTSQSQSVLSMLILLRRFIKCSFCELTCLLFPPLWMQFLHISIKGINPFLSQFNFFLFLSIYKFNIFYIVLYPSDFLTLQMSSIQDRYTDPPHHHISCSIHTLHVIYLHRPSFTITTVTLLTPAF